MMGEALPDGFRIKGYIGFRQQTDGSSWEVRHPSGLRYFRLPLCNSH